MLQTQKINAFIVRESSTTEDSIVLVHKESEEINRNYLCVISIGTKSDIVDSVNMVFKSFPDKIFELVIIYKTTSYKILDFFFEMNKIQP